jgi:hypothetical protein
MNRVEILYIEGCPNVDVALDHVHKALAAAGDPAQPHLVRVDEEADAVRRQFLGSPTIRVNGVDVDASAHARNDFGMQCRVYWAEGNMIGAPPVHWIEAALRGGKVYRECAEEGSLLFDGCCRRNQ